MIQIKKCQKLKWKPNHVKLCSSMTCEFSHLLAVTCSDFLQVILMYITDISCLQKYILIINHYFFQDPWPYNLAHCFPSPPTPGQCFYTTAQHMHPIKPCLASFAPQLPPADRQSDSDRAQKGFYDKTSLTWILIQNQQIKGGLMTKITAVIKSQAP